MPLPVLTTADDARSIVAYLRTKPTGATNQEAKATLDKRLLDWRKLSAYETWGLVQRTDGRLSLAPAGWELARSSDGGELVFRAVLDSIVPYRSALEWAHHRGFEAITNVDVAAHWHQHHSEQMGTDNENTMKDGAVCFFHLCEAAGFGSVTLGRKGNPTRLSINRGVLRGHIEAGPTAPPWHAPDGEKESQGGQVLATEEEPTLAPPLGVSETREVRPPLRVFIAHGPNMEIVEQIETMLGLADIESEVAEAEETTAIPVPEKVFNAMRRCGAGIIAVTADDGRKTAEGGYALNENVLIEIGAAFVLYDRKVVLVWDKRIPVPSNLQGLYRCEFEGDELSWSAGMKLMKAIQEFKK
jgi:CAP12/Pycsar effector protein, TIR domain